MYLGAWILGAGEDVKKFLEWIETAKELGREILIPKGKLAYA